MRPGGPHSAASFAVEAGILARERRKPLVGRIRFQLGGALLVGILLPVLLRWPVTTLHLEFIASGMLLPSFLGAAIAIVMGYTLIRQFIIYPGVKATAYILPSLAASFAVVALFFFFLRIDYSRYIFLASSILSVAWLYAVFALRNRYTLPVLALVPDGNHRGITSIAGAQWLRLSSPKSTLEGVEAVVADLHADLPEKWGRFIAKCVLAGVPVYHVKSVIESLTGRVAVEHLAENSFGSVLPSRHYLHVKRGLDVLLALLLLPLFVIVMAITAIFIKLETRGPTFFTQPRMGFRGNIFTCLKLRSMSIGGAEGQHFTSAEDPRVTTVGQFIRKYRIDEFPQIFNILKGEMSWIGPRPEAIALAEWYAKEIPFYIYRHAVRPGISGWAQVSQGNVAEVEAATVKLQYDFYYIKNFSPWLDFLIVLKTLKTILTGFGSK